MQPLLALTHTTPSYYGIWQNVCTRCQAALDKMNIAPPQPEANQ